MKFTFFKRILLIISIFWLFFSCSSDLDFQQVDEFNIQPTVTTNLAYINLEASNFITNGAETPFFSYVSNVDFFETAFVSQNLIKAELYFRIKNSIARAYVFNVTFLNKENIPIYNIKIDVPEGRGADVIIEKTETFTPANLDKLKNSTHMIFSVRMLSGTPITNTSTGRVEFSSSITAYFDVE
jgi:hypothetical protein